MFSTVEFWQWCSDVEDSAPVLICNDYRNESSLAEYLDKGSVTGGGGLVCELTGKCTLGVQIFLIWY